MVSRNSRGRPLSAPAFIHPCQPTVAKQPLSGPGWVHELKHDGYRLQIRHLSGLRRALLFVRDNFGLGCGRLHP